MVSPVWGLRPFRAFRLETLKVPKPVKEDRVRRLRTLDQAKRLLFYQTHTYTVQNVLVERKNRKTGLLQGFSENYLPIRFKGPESLRGKVVAVRVDQLKNGELHGSLEKTS